MPVPSSLDDLSTTPALNYPAGSESPSTADDYFRAHAALLKQVDNKAAGLRADLAADAPGKGASLVGYDGGTVQDVLDSAKPMANYTALRAYTGRATAVRITTPGIAGFFQRDADTTTADNGGTVIVDGSGGRWKRVFDGPVNVKWFGAKGDGVTDDRIAVQSFVNYLTDHHCHGYAPEGRYLLAGKIDFACTYGWGIRGAGATATVFVQAVDNIPIFDLGVIPASYMHSYVLEDFSFDYSNTQPHTNTNATPIKFSEMGFQGAFHRLTFTKGSWAIKVEAGIGGPWGQNWDDLNFGGGLTGGAMDWTGSVNGVPNNKWGRMLVTATNMVGPIFKGIRGYNWTWDTLELLDGKDAQWITCQAGSEVTIGAIKMELCRYTGNPTMAGDSLIYSPNSYVQIGQVHIGGTWSEFLFTAARYLINVSVGTVQIDHLHTKNTLQPTNFYLYAGSGVESRINYQAKGAYPVAYTNVGSAVAAETLTVTPDLNSRMSANKGDSDYTVSGGDAGLIRFETPLTAPRTVNLPASNDCFNGLRYRVISYGAVNGANTLSVKAANNTKATLTADKSFVELTWRRNATPHAGWLITDAGTLP